MRILDVRTGEPYEALAGAVVMTCGACGRSWDDSVVTSRTPAPAGRCPFEFLHPDVRGTLFRSYPTPLTRYRITVVGSEGNSYADMDLTEEQADAFRELARLTDTADLLDPYIRIEKSKP